MQMAQGRRPGSPLLLRLARLGPAMAAMSAAAEGSVAADLDRSSESAGSMDPDLSSYSGTTTYSVMTTDDADEEMLFLRQKIRSHLVMLYVNILIRRPCGLLPAPLPWIV